MLCIQAGDEEYNPLAQYDDLDAEKQAEIKTKQVVRPLSIVWMSVR